jgi:flagellar assembly protein FliH
VPFGFGEIQRPSAVDPCEVDADSGHSAEDPVGDPFKELEETIQERLLDAERRAQEIEREAYEQGYAQGLKDGTDFGRKGMLVTQEHMEKILAELQSLPAQILLDYRNWLVASCIAISRHVIQKELRTRPQVLHKLIQNLLEEVEPSQSLTLTLHPQDLEMLTRHTSFRAPTEGSEHAFIVKTDPRLERGGCCIESDIQRIDAGIDTQLRRIEQELKAEGMVGSDVESAQ